MRIKLFSVLVLLTLILHKPQQTFAEEISSGSSATFATILEQQRQDNRAKILQEYLTKMNSPLAPYANEFVSTADTYTIPWYLVAAISGTESTFGQQVPHNCNNAWGFGVFGNQTLCFESYSQAIKKISQSLREDYMNKWKANSIEEIGSIYAASPAWAMHTQYFIDQIVSYKDNYESRTIPISL